MSAEHKIFSVVRNHQERMEREELNLSEDLAEVKVTVAMLQETVNNLKEQHSDLHSSSSQEIMKMKKEIEDLKKLNLEVADLERKEGADEEKVEATEIQLDLDHQVDVSKELTTDDLLQTSPGYRFQENMWDACAFIGFECVDRTSSALIVVIALYSAVLEALFAIVVYVNYRVHPYTDENLAGLLHWRAMEAQSLANMDATTHVSLASAVCSEAASIGIAGSQATIFADLKLFRGRDVASYAHMFNGHFLCNLALFLWILSILRDLWQNWCLMSAVARHVGGAPSIQEVGDEIRIVSFSFTQKLLVAFLVFLPRTAIDLMLGYAGVWFLCYTANIGELILNAVALVFVLDIDELFHQFLLMEKVKDLMSLVQPLPHRRNLESCCSRYAASGFHIFGFRILMTGIALLMCNLLVIFPFNERLDTALAYLCAGNKDFVYSRGLMTGMISFSEASQFDANSMYALTFPKLAVLQLMDLPQKYAVKFGLEGIPQAAIERPVAILKGLATNNAEVESYTVICVDHTDVEAVVNAYPDMELAKAFFLSAQSLLRDFTPGGENNALDCPDLDFKRHCLGTRIYRALCAKRCGCDTPWQGQFYATTSSGCPGQCLVQWEVSAQYFTPTEIAKYTDECKDVRKEVLFTEQAWHNYVKGATDYMAMYTSLDVVAKVKGALLANGCKALPAAARFLDVCNPHESFRSARLWCPKTCLCSSSDIKECPNSCSYKLRYRQMPAGHACTPTTEVESAAECKKAYYGLNQENQDITAWSNAFAPPSGCFLSSAGLMFSKTGGGTLDSGSIAICKAHPLIFDTISQGSFETGRNKAVGWMNLSTRDWLQST